MEDRLVMKKVLFTAKNLEFGGVEKSLVRLLNRIDFDRYQVTLVLEEKRGPLLETLDPRVDVQEYRMSSAAFVPLRRAQNFLKRMFWTLRHRNRYDFSCSYCTYSVIGSRLAQAASFNSCLYVHNDYALIYPAEADYHAFFDQLRVNCFAHIVHVSEQSRAGFCKRLPNLSERAVVINNLIDADQIRMLANEPCEYSRDPDETVFIYLGRLSEEQKRITRLLEGMRHALEKRQDIRLLLVGDGPDRAMYEKMIQDLDLAAHVHLYGAQMNPYPFLAAADCLILTSDFEGFPVVYYEALILHKNIITTVPTSDEWIDMVDYSDVIGKTAAAAADAMVRFEPHSLPALHMEEANQKRMRRLMGLVEQGGTR